MSNIGDLRRAVFDYLNVDGQSILDTTLDLGGSENSRKAKIHNLFLVAANNARKRAERKHDFSFADVTVLGSIPADNTGLSFDECYISPRYEETLITDGTGDDTLTKTNVPFDGKTNMIVTDQGGEFALGKFVVVTVADPLVGTLYVNGEVVVAGTYMVWALAIPNNIINPLSYDPAKLVQIKTVQATYYYDDNPALWRPIRFTSQKIMNDMLIENLDRQSENQVTLDEETIIIQGRKFFTYPVNTAAINLRVDVNRWMPDYKDDNDTDAFIEHGFEYMMWACVVEINRLTKTFVIRQDGNLPPPESARDDALEELIKMDIYQTEENQNFRQAYGR